MVFLGRTKSSYMLGLFVSLFWENRFCISNFLKNVWLERKNFVFTCKIILMGECVTENEFSEK